MGSPHWRLGPGCSALGCPRRGGHPEHTVSLVDEKLTEYMKSESNDPVLVIEKAK
jgi:hypothetical protein